MKKQNTVHDKKDEFFRKLSLEAVKFIASLLDQKDKYNLLRMDKLSYKTMSPILYKNVVIIATSTEKNVKNIDKQKRFLYPTDKSIISGRTAMYQFFRTINKKVFTYDGSSQVAALMSSFRCYYCYIPKGYKFHKVENDQVLTLQDLEDTFFDCFGESWSFEKKRFPIADDLCMNLLKALVKLQFCKDISIPTFVYSKLVHNIEHHDFIRGQEMVRGVERNFVNYYKNFVKGELFLDKIRISNGLRLSLKNLTSLRISFADPFLARSILASCDSSKLKSLTLDHFCCGFGCYMSYYYTTEQLNRKFLLIDEFFKMENIYNIFCNLDNLELVFHNGYNRPLFRKFLFSLNSFIINKKRRRNNMQGRLLLKSFVIRESTSDFAKVHQFDNMMPAKMSHVHREDRHKSISMLAIVDLLDVSRYFSIFEVINFSELRLFKLYLKCFPNGIDILKFREDYYKDFFYRLVAQMSKNPKPGKAIVDLDYYDKSVMIPNEIVVDEASN